MDEAGPLPGVVQRRVRIAAETANLQLEEAKRIAEASGVRGDAYAQLLPALLIAISNNYSAAVTKPPAR